MVDQLLGGLFGGQADDDAEAPRRRARDFVSRYEQGPPHEGYSDEEVFRNYRAVEGRLSDEEYEEAAAEAFGRMSPEERRQLRRMMKERSGGRFDLESDDPRELARTTSRFRKPEQESGGFGLGDLLGFGGGDDDRRGDLVSAARGGDGGGGMFDSPVAKAALAGVAAMAMKKMLDR